MKENVVEFPDRAAVEKEAGAWLVKLDGDQPPSAEDLASLGEWLERSPVHREELGNLAAFWGKMNVLTELAVPLGKPDDRKSHDFLEGLRRAAFRYGRVGVAAAAIAAGLAVAFAVWLRPDPYAAGNGFYATAVGQQQTQRLADGSIVLLNTNSQIKVDYGKQYRDIRLLQGEAHFTVARNTGRPFRVYAGTGRVQAVGTAFSVYLKDNAVDVTVTEGRVALASLGQSGAEDLPNRAVPSDGRQSSGSVAVTDDGYVGTLATLRAGQSATIKSVLDARASISSTLDAIETIDAHELARRLSWREGVLMFAGDPLEAVVDEISRYTTVSIEISDPAVKNIKIGGRFPVGETEAMLDALEANFGLRVTRVSHNHVLLSAAEE